MRIVPGNHIHSSILCALAGWPCILSTYSILMHIIGNPAALLCFGTAQTVINGTIVVDLSAALHSQPIAGDKFGILHAINVTDPPSQVLDPLPVKMFASSSAGRYFYYSCYYHCDK